MRGKSILFFDCSKNILIFVSFSRSSNTSVAGGNTTALRMRLVVDQSKRALRVCEVHNTRLFVQVILRWRDGLVMDADILSWSVPLAPWRSLACRHGRLLQDGLIGFVLDMGNPSGVNRLPAILSRDDLVCAVMSKGRPSSRVASHVVELDRANASACAFESANAARSLDRRTMHRSNHHRWGDA